MENIDSGNTFCLPKQNTYDRKVSSHMLSSKCKEGRSKRFKKKKEPPPKLYDVSKWYGDLQMMCYYKMMGKTFEVDQKVLYESKFPPEPGKLKTGWFSPLKIQGVDETGEIKIKSLDPSQSVLVNCHKLKLYLDASPKKMVEEVPLSPQKKKLLNASRVWPHILSEGTIRRQHKIFFPSVSISFNYLYFASLGRINF